MSSTRMLSRTSLWSPSRNANEAIGYCREYAIAVFGGFPSLQVVNDLGCPSWEASWLFDVVDGAVPSDWSCNLLHDEPSFLLGAEFITRDEQAYRAMVELDADQVDRFWKRVRDLEPNTVVNE